MRLVLITPQVARDMLKNNIENNRTIIQKTVQLYKSQMLSGNWVNQHPGTYSVNNEGKLLDGQHRLSAIVESGMSFYGWITQVDTAVMPTIDEGRKRTAGSAAQVIGIPNANVVVASIRTYKSLCDNKVQRIITYSNLDIIDAYYKDKDRIDRILNVCKSLYLKNKIISPSVTTALWMYFDDIDPEGAESFINQLVTGRDIINETILILRDRLIQEKTNIRKTSQSNLIALIVKTWNSCRRGVTLKVLKFNIVSEKYPVAI